MNPLMPILTLFRFANTLGTVVLIGQVSWWCYKKYTELNATKLRSSEIKVRFLSDFLEKFGRMPTDDEIDVALNAADAIDHPLKHQFKQFMKSLIKK